MMHISSQSGEGYSRDLARNENILIIECDYLVFLLTRIEYGSELLVYSIFIHIFTHIP